MASNPEFPTTFDDLRQATPAQRQAIYRRVINDPEIVRELVRAMTVAEADAVIDALESAANRLRGTDRAAPPSAGPGPNLSAA